MTKTPEMENYLGEITRKIFGRSRQDSACVTCGSPKIKQEDFRNIRSWDEFGISHMCQACQDDTFGVD
jgi:hypothetical protein